MDPCKDRPGDVPEPWLCPDSKLSVSKANIPSRSSGTSRNSPSLHTPTVPSIGWYLISMLTLVLKWKKSWWKWVKLERHNLTLKHVDKFYLSNDVINNPSESYFPFISTKKSDISTTPISNTAGCWIKCKQKPRWNDLQISQSNVLFTIEHRKHIKYWKRHIYYFTKNTQIVQ